MKVFRKKKNIKKKKNGKKMRKMAIKLLSVLRSIITDILACFSPFFYALKTAQKSLGKSP